MKEFKFTLTKLRYRTDIIISIVFIVVFAFLVLGPLIQIIYTSLTYQSNDLRVVRDARVGQFTLYHYLRVFTGKEIELSPGVPDAGYEWLYRVLHNELIILKSGSKVAAASGTKGQSEPPVVITSFTYLRYNASKGYMNAIITPLDPVESLIYPTYTAIARQAPHPNAAKLMTAFLLGDPAINKDTVIKEPYNEGKSAELLQGLAPYYEVGSTSPRSDVPIPKGGEIWNRLKSWVTDPEFMWYDGPKVQDFWVQEAGE